MEALVFLGTGDLPPAYSEVEQDPAAYAPSSPAKAGLDAEFRGYSCDACGKEFRWPAGKFKAAQAQHELACGGAEQGHSKKGDVAGRIEFVGLWKDTADRAMPIKTQVNPGNPRQMLEAVDSLLNELVASGSSAGIVAFQSYNQCHWSAAPGDEGYKKHRL